MQAEAMARLDAVLGRSPLDATGDGPAEAPPTELWVDQDPAAAHQIRPR